jgi:predicted enzyme related to lactoylglutathione lyase
MAQRDTGEKIYMRVDDLDVYLDRPNGSAANGSCRRRTLPGNYGWFAILADPDGNAVDTNSAAGRWGACPSPTGPVPT